MKGYDPKKFHLFILLNDIEYAEVCEVCQITKEELHILLIGDKGEFTIDQLIAIKQKYKIKLFDFF